jgi:hypothetical protein
MPALPSSPPLLELPPRVLDAPPFAGLPLKPPLLEAVPPVPPFAEASSTQRCEKQVRFALQVPFA